MMLAVSVVYRRVGSYAVESIYHLIFKCTIFRECVAFFVDSLRDLDPNFNEISIILGIKCSNSTLDQICNIAILLFINFAHSMRTSRPAPTKEILKRFLSINFRNLCLFSIHMGLESHVYSIVSHVTFLKRCCLLKSFLF